MISTATCNCRNYLVALPYSYTARIRNRVDEKCDDPEIEPPPFETGQFNTKTNPVFLL